MKWTPRRIAFHIIMLIVVLVVLAMGIWLRLGPAVHSQQI
jgi:hypothetical protein